MNTLFEVEPEPDHSAELPEIQGTEKQIPWAIAIRKKRLVEIAQYLRKHRLHAENLKDLGRTEAYERERTRYRAELDREEELRRIDQARFWIDHRDNSAQELLENGPAKPGGGFR